jgi:hypothetical protein
MHTAALTWSANLLYNMMQHGPCNSVLGKTINSTLSVVGAVSESLRALTDP